DGWSELYEFTQEPQRHKDYAIYNHFAATHTTSPFVNQIVAIRITPDVRYTLRDRMLAVGQPDGTSEERAVAADDLGETLRETFGIGLSVDEVATLLDPPVDRPSR